MISTQDLCKIIASICDKNDITSTTIHPESNLYEDLALTSMDMLMIFYILEKEYSLKVNCWSNELKTVDDLYRMLEEKNG